MTPDTNQPQAPLEDWVLVGVIAGAFGVRGECKVKLHTDFPDRFKKQSKLYMGADHRPMTVESSRPLHDRVALKLVEVADREAAQALFDTPLYVRRSDVVPLPEGRYYHDQIIGLRVETTDGRSLGTIVEVLQTGSNDVYVARDDEREVLIPAIKDVVREIDVENGHLRVEPIEGLL